MHIALVQFYSDQPTPDYQEIADALRERGHTVWVGTVNKAGVLVWRDGEEIIAVQHRPRSLPCRWFCIGWVAPLLNWITFHSYMLNVRSFLRKSQPEIVHVNPAGVRGVWLLPLLMPYQTRFVLDLRQVSQLGGTGIGERARDWVAKMKRQIWARAFYHHTCFLHAAGAEKILGQRWSRWATVVPLGVDSCFLTRERTPATLPSNQAPIHFLYVGSMSRIRRLERLLYAARRVLSVNAGFQLVFLGRTADRDQEYYHRLAEELGLSSVVTFRSPVQYRDVPNEILKHDVMLAYVPERPADWQYHPTLKVLEYRALGMPIIATDFPPDREVVESGVNGFLVSNSVEDLTDAMLRFVCDRDFLGQCQANALQMRRGATWREVTEMYERQVYIPLKNRARWPG